MKKLVEESFREWRSAKDLKPSGWRRPTKKELNEFRQPIPALFIGPPSDALEQFPRYTPVNVAGLDIEDFEHQMGDYPVYNNTLFVNVDKASPGVQNEIINICRRREDVVVQSFDEGSIPRELFACTRTF